MTALERIDATAALLVERARPVDFRAASSATEVQTAQRLRGAALLERGWATEADLEEGREIDADDDRATHLLAWLDGVAVGTCRLVYPDPWRPLPLVVRHGVARVPAHTVEIGRIAVARRSGTAERSITAGLIGRSWLEIRAQGDSRICGTGSAAVLRLYRRLGFLVTVIGPPITLFGEERFPVLFEPTDEAAALAMSASPAGVNLRPS